MIISDHIWFRLTYLKFETKARSLKLVLFFIFALFQVKCNFCDQVFRQTRSYYGHANAYHHEIIQDKWCQCPVNINRSQFFIFKIKFFFHFWLNTLSILNTFSIFLKISSTLKSFNIWTRMKYFCISVILLISKELRSWLKYLKMFHQPIVIINIIFIIFFRIVRLIFQLQKLFAVINR